MSGEMAAINLVNSNSQVKSHSSNKFSNKSSNKSNSASNQDNNFLSSLQEKQNNTRKKTSDLKGKRTNSSGKEEKITTEITDKELKKLKELIKKNPEKLSDKDLETLLANLSKILQKFSQQLKQQLETNNLDQKQMQKVVDSLLANGEQLKNIIGNFNSKENNSLKEIMKRLTALQEQLTAKQEESSKQLKTKKLEDQLKNNLSKLKKLVEKTNAKVVESKYKSNSKQNLANQKLINRFNLAQNSKQEQKTSSGNQSQGKIDLASIDLSKLINKQGTTNSQNIEINGQAVDLKSITANNNDSSINFNSLELGQFNLENKNFSQAISKESMTTKTVDFKNLLGQIDSKIDFTAIKRGNKVTMQLEPEFLGKIQMKVGVEDGSVTAKILAESNQVKELLNGNLTKLKATLEQKGIEIDQLDVDVGYEEGQLSEQDNSQQEFLFKKQQEKNSLNQFSFGEETGQLSAESLEAEDENVIIDDQVDYMA